MKGASRRRALQAVGVGLEVSGVAGEMETERERRDRRRARGRDDALALVA